MSNSRKAVSVKLYDGTVSVGTNFSGVLNIPDATRVSAFFHWSGSPLYTTTLQTTNDPLANHQGSESRAAWYDEPTTISGSGGTVSGTSVIHLQNVECSALRFKFDVLTAGTLKVYATSKE